MGIKIFLLIPLWLAISPVHSILDDTKRFLPCDIVETTSISDKRHDSVVLVAHNVDELTFEEAYGSTLRANIIQFLEHDKGSVDSGPVLILIPKQIIPSSRLILAFTGRLDRDFDDVRRYSDAATAGIKRALKTGSKAPLLVVQSHENYPTAQMVSVIAALAALYTPLEIRELRGDSSKKANFLGIYAHRPDEARKLIEAAAGVEAGRYVARDICGSDPVRMSPIKTADYVNEAFKGFSNSISIRVIDDEDQIERDYPLLAAVNRASKTTPQHQVRVIWLEYTGTSPITDTVMLVGKGVTLDTGGLDLKTGGSMYSMSRDKCGAASVAGFFKILDALQPKGLRAVGVMVMVRNNVGPNAFSCDEILTSRADKRIRIVNTDAEGRMAMLDPLFEMKERALNETNPQLYTIGTLTGHAMRAVGDGYTIVMDNGPAKEAKSAILLQAAGEAIGDMMEISTIRREDYEAHTSSTEYENLLQSASSKGSVSQKRGHQKPAAFLIMGSGLDMHGKDSNSRPLKFSHLDMAPTAGIGDFPQIPPASPVAALAARHILNRLIRL